MRNLLLLTLLGLSVLLSGCLRRDLLNNLTEQEAQEIAVVLSNNGIGAAIKRADSGKKETNAVGAWRVEIHGAEETLIDAWKVLQHNGLPHPRDTGLSEAFGAGGLIPTASEEKAKLLVGLSGEISRTLKAIPGVVDARVHVVLPDNSPLLEKNEWAQPTASVLLKYGGTEKPPDDNSIKALVAKSVQGLKPENVTLMSTRVVPMPYQDSFPVRRIFPTIGLLLDYAYRVLILLLLLIFGPVIYRKFLQTHFQWVKERVSGFGKKAPGTVG